MVESLGNAPSLEIESFASGVVDLRLHGSMNLPFGSFTSRPSGVVEVNVRTEAGIISGYGEGATLPKPLFTDDSAETIADAGRFILEDITKSKFVTPKEVFSCIQDFKFPGGQKFPTARMMVEMAVIDACAKSVGSSVRDLLGVPKAMTGVKYGKSLGEGNSENIVEQAEEALRSGATKIKLKISPSSHMEVVKAIKTLKTLGQFEIMVDANGSFDPNDKKHLDILKTIDELGLLMIEEPVSRTGENKGINAVRAVRKEISFQTPICLDDCLVDYETTMLAMEDELADVVNIKPGRIGSIIRSIELNSYCQEKGIQVMVGGMLEATPGRCMTVTLAALFSSLGSKIPGDLSLAQERLAQDLVDEDYFLRYDSVGQVVIPNGFGWGFGNITLF